MTAVDIIARRRPALTDAELMSRFQEGVLRIDAWFFCTDGVVEQLIVDAAFTAAIPMRRTNQNVINHSAANFGPPYNTTSMTCCPAILYDSIALP